MLYEHVRILGITADRSAGVAKLWVYPLDRKMKIPFPIYMDPGKGLRAVATLFGALSEAPGQEALVATDEGGMLESISRPAQGLDPDPN